MKSKMHLRSTVFFVILLSSALGSLSSNQTYFYNESLSKLSENYNEIASLNNTKANDCNHRGDQVFYKNVSEANIARSVEKAAQRGFHHKNKKNTNEKDDHKMPLKFQETLGNVTLQEEVFKNDVKDNISSIKRSRELENNNNDLRHIKRSTAISSDNEYTNLNCIQCSNVERSECTSPLGKEVPKVQCPNREDLCYSQHTPFGVVNRGCYNMNNDMSVFVCSCNLCNYISFTEMPYIFSNQQEWAKNVEELSRMINFRKSIYKKMSCLSCHVNMTNAGPLDTDENAYCMDGNVIKVPAVECPQDKICGVRSQRSTGYLWRGCLRTPRYNYWYAICDSDNCNNDNIVSSLL